MCQSLFSTYLLSLCLGAALATTLSATRAAEPARQKQFETTWDSLTDREPAEWLLDAKFGIYTHWGVYSVPAHESEWYPKRMYDIGRRGYAKHHTQKWGNPKEFNYHQFVDMFKAEKWDPAHWARLMKATGAKYAGMAVVHHDGFLLWDSKVNRWNAAEMGPKRDCFGQYCEALRAEGLKTIATFHHIRTFNWYLPDVLSRPPETAPPVALDQGEPLKLHVFIDKSVVEVFANGKQCVALRVYPGRKDSVGVSLRAQGQDAQLRSLDA